MVWSWSRRPMAAAPNFLLGAVPQSSSVSLAPLMSHATQRLLLIGPRHQPNLLRSCLCLEGKLWNCCADPTTARYHSPSSSLHTITTSGGSAELPRTASPDWLICWKQSQLWYKYGQSSSDVFKNVSCNCFLGHWRGRRACGHFGPAGSSPPLHLRSHSHSQGAGQEASCPERVAWSLHQNLQQRVWPHWLRLVCHWGPSLCCFTQHHRVRSSSSGWSTAKHEHHPFTTQERTDCRRVWENPSLCQGGGLAYQLLKPKGDFSFQLKVISLLRNAPQCAIPFNKFIPAYHHHFGRQCRLSDYGVTKLTELLSAVGDVVEVWLVFFCAKLKWLKWWHPRMVEGKSWGRAELQNSGALDYILTDHISFDLIWFNHWIIHWACSWLGGVLID